MNCTKPSSLTRRNFIKTGTAAAAGLSLADDGFAAPKNETLAVNDGSKTVTFPPTNTLS
jgi:hypothetical protein